MRARSRDGASAGATGSEQRALELSQLCSTVAQQFVEQRQRVTGFVDLQRAGPPIMQHHDLLNDQLFRRLYQ